ncbi:MAG: hypothetical protein AAFY91_12695 [Bacteroidota bacterium]
MRQIVSGRVAANPIRISNRRAFINYLDQNAARTESVLKFQIPLLSRKTGYVFFRNEKRILIRYNSERLLGFTSLCFFSGKIESDGNQYRLRGSYRFPTFLEVPKYLVLAFTVIWTIFFGYLVVTGSPKLIEDTVVFVLGLFVLGVGSTLFGNVSISFFARNSMKKVNDLLARFSEC